MLGLNKVYNLDCIDFLKQIDDKSIDLIIIDPPYNLHRFNYGNKSDFQEQEDYERWCKKWMKELSRILKDTGSFYCWINRQQLGFYQQELDKLLKYRNTIIWYFKGGRASRKRKNYEDRYEVCLFYTKSDSYTFNKDRYFIPLEIEQLLADKRALKNIVSYKKNYKQVKETYERLLKHGKLMTNVWDDIGHFSGNRKKKGSHPNEKPVRLIERLILMSSNEDDIVLDCFGGSGSTYIAAMKNKRRFIGCEVERKWHDYINTRIDAYNKQVKILPKYAKNRESSKTS